MSVVVVDGLAIYYETYGEGVPAVLIPRCNFAWSALDLAVLTGDYTVVIASPRGFGESDRTEGPYTAASIKSDLEAVPDHVGVGEYVSFGYSMTGSVAPWLAHENPRVRAVISGGFPIATAYTNVLPYISANRADTFKDPRRWQTMTEKFDPEALMAWYLELDKFPPAGLLDVLDCPLYSFWGGDDEVIEELAGLEALRAGMQTRRLPFEVVPGRDHEGMLNSINEAMPHARRWLNAVVPPQGECGRAGTRPSRPA